MKKQKRKHKCIECTYCTKLDNNILKILFPDYPYICSVPTFVSDEPNGKLVTILPCEMIFMTEHAVKTETVCKYYKGYDT